MVIGDRDPSRLEHFSPAKRILQRLGSWAVRQLSGTTSRTRPAASAPSAASAALKLNVLSDFTYTLETIIQAGKKQIAIAHVPVRARPTLAAVAALLGRVALHPALGGDADPHVRLLRAVQVLRPARRRHARWSASVIGVRFLYDYFTEGGAGHIQSLILAGALARDRHRHVALRPARRSDRPQSSALRGDPAAHAAARAARRRRTRGAPSRSAGARARRGRAAALARRPPAAMIRAVLFGTYTATHPANRLLAAALEAGRHRRSRSVTSRSGSGRATRRAAFFGVAEPGAARPRVPRRGAAAAPPLSRAAAARPRRHRLQRPARRAARAPASRAGAHALVFAPLVTLTETLVDDRRVYRRRRAARASAARRARPSDPRCRRPRADRHRGASDAGSRTPHAARPHGDALPRRRAVFRPTPPRRVAPAIRCACSSTGSTCRCTAPT